MIPRRYLGAREGADMLDPKSTSVSATRTIEVRVAESTVLKRREKKSKKISKMRKGTYVIAVIGIE